MPDKPKNHNNWTTIIIDIAIIIVCVAIAWATIKGEVKSNTEDIAEIKKITSKNTDTIIDYRLLTTAQLTEISTKLESMSITIDEIKAEVKKN